MFLVRVAVNSRIDLEDDDLHLPQDAIGPFKPVTGSEIDWFNSIFSDEIDSAFASSIRCCDQCIDDFQQHWPGTASRNFEFQKGSIPVDLAVIQSRIPDCYSPAEVSTLIHFVRCPRCENYPQLWIWIHEHAAADELETEISQLSALANRTPFLILENQFAQRVLMEIRGLGEAASTIQLPSRLYRARKAEEVEPDIDGSIPAAQFGPPLAKYVQEGRFNHAGLPMLYLADSLPTTIAEIGTPGQSFCVATLGLKSKFKVLDLIINEPDEPKWELLGAIAASALMSAPRTGDGWVKKEYIFTRFVADCAIDAGFDAIRYGSTKLNTGYNYVLVKPPEDISKLFQILDSQSILG